jgi:[acyl-carrier-protein] S-malonyltransferase
VLSGLLRKIDRTKKALNVEDPDSLAKTLKELDSAAVAN